MSHRQVLERMADNYNLHKCMGSRWEGLVTPQETAGEASVVVRVRRTMSDPCTFVTLALFLVFAGGGVSR